MYYLKIVPFGPKDGEKISHILLIKNLVGIDWFFLYLCYLRKIGIKWGNAPVIYRFQESLWFI